MIAAAIVVLVACNGQRRRGKHGAIGQTAPDWKDPLLSGGLVVDGAAAREAGLHGLLCDWCPPCNDEAPEVNAAYKEYAPRGLQVIGVDVEENAQKAKQFVDQHQLTYPAVVDSGTLSDLYSINGMPVGVFIDKNGVIRRIEVGQLSSAQLNADIKSIL